MINSTQHSIRRSRASLAKVWPDEDGRISVIIFCTVAAGELFSIRYYLNSCERARRGSRSRHSKRLSRDKG